MKKLFLKITLAIFTFAIGICVVSLFYLFRLDAESQKSLPEAISSVKITVENPCDYPQPKYRELEAEEAVYLAECFIIQNGYTDLPPIADKSKLTPENVFPLINEEGMKMRHDSLERKAYSYERNTYLYGGSWVIMFRYKPHADVLEFYGDKLNYIGRGVVMDFYGKDIRIRHSDLPLKMPDAKIIIP